MSRNYFGATQYEGMIGRVNPEEVEKVEELAPVETNSEIKDIQNKTDPNVEINYGTWNNSEIFKIQPNIQNNVLT